MEQAIYLHQLQHIDTYQLPTLTLDSQTAMDFQWPTVHISTLLKI